jgi:hypothetical protein
MKRIPTWNAVAALVLVLSIFAAPIAQAVRLDSSGSNNEYVGVSNYAFSYSGTPLYLTARCYLNGAKDSSWEAPSTCDDSGENCWATTTCEGDCSDVDAYLSMESMRKAYLHYYARDHKDSGQGTCSFTIGSTSFGLSFDYEDTGEDFTLSLQITDEADPTWRGGTGETCWGGGTASSGPVSQVFTTNDDAQNSQSNTICNEDFIINLAADPSISNGAGIAVTNNPYGLQQAVQEAPSTSTAAAKPATTYQAGDSSPAESAGRRRLANRVSDEGRWLIASDSDGEALHGVLVSGADDETVEFATCLQISSNDEIDPASAAYTYLCDFLSEDGTSTRNQLISLPGSNLRARPLTDLSKTREVRAAGTEIPIGSNAAIRQLAQHARVSRPRPPLIETKGATEQAASRTSTDNLIWHAESDTGRIAMLQNEQEGRLEIVRHSSVALSPSFTSCAEVSQNEREIQYLCRGNLRCTGTPCPEESWSVGTLVDFPRALFKPRPCLEGQGSDPIRPLLRLTRLGQPGDKARLRFDSTVQLPPGEKIQPQKDGFRFLVEDADGNTVVDLDLPPNPKHKKSRAHGKKKRRRAEGRWQVSKGGQSFLYRSGPANGGMVPTVKIDRARGKGPRKWSVRVYGRKGTFGEEPLSLPLTASLSLDPPNPNSAACASVDFSQAGRPDCRVRERPGGSVITCRTR